MRVLVPLVTTTLIICAGCGGGSAELVERDAPTGASTAEVVRVVDGDTVIVRENGDGFTVRLLGIDTPESVKPNSPVECLGPEASARAKELLPEGSPVRVTTDPTQDRVDRFGRTLAYVFAGDATRSVNEQLVSEGFARVFISRGTPFQLERRFSLQEMEARASASGIWGECRVPGAISDGAAPNGRDCPDDRAVKGNLPSRVYHRPGDPDYGATNPERCFANAASAEADGFRPAVR